MYYTVDTKRKTKVRQVYFPITYTSGKSITARNMKSLSLWYKSECSQLKVKVKRVYLLHFMETGIPQPAENGKSRLHMMPKVSLYMLTRVYIEAFTTSRIDVVLTLD